MFHNNNSNKNHSREFCSHLCRARPKLLKAMEMPPPVQQALSLHWEEAGGKSSKGCLWIEAMCMWNKGRTMALHHQETSLSGQEYITMGNSVTVTLRVCYQLTAITHPQLNWLVPHTGLPLLFDLEGTVSTGTQWCLSWEEQKMFFNLLQHFVFQNSEASCVSCQKKWGK